MLPLVAAQGEEDGVVLRALVGNLDDPDRRCRAQVCECIVAIASREQVVVEEVVVLIEEEEVEEEVKKRW